MLDELLETTQGRTRRQVQLLKQHITHNLPFIRDMFQDQMDRIVTEAKADVEAFINSRLKLDTSNPPELPKYTLPLEESPGQRP